MRSVYLWLHALISNRLFNNKHGFFSLYFNIWYFSSRHKLHWFDGLLFVVAWLIIFQVILNFEFFFFNLQTYLESSVSFWYFSWLNDLLWLLYLSLNVVLVNPIYATCSFSKDTVALYMMQLERQFPSSGHLVGCLQLHVFLLGSMMFFPFMIFALIIINNNTKLQYP